MRSNLLPWLFTIPAVAITAFALWKGPFGSYGNGKRAAFILKYMNWVVVEDPVKIKLPQSDPSPSQLKDERVRGMKIYLEDDGKIYCSASHLNGIAEIPDQAALLDSIRKAFRRGEDTWSQTVILDVGNEILYKDVAEIVQTVSEQEGRLIFNSQTSNN